MVETRVSHVNRFFLYAEEIGSSGSHCSRQCLLYTPGQMIHMPPGQTVYAHPRAGQVRHCCMPQVRRYMHTPGQAKQCMPQVRQ